MRRGRLLAVLESKWFANEITARPLFDLLCDARHDRGDYLYERFVSKASLEDVLKFAIKKRVSYIYIGSHCHRSQIHCPNGDHVDVRRLRDVILQQSEAVGTRITGLYLSGCYIVTDKNAATLFGKGDNPYTPRWFGGYGGSPEWFPSSAFDTLFFSEYFAERGHVRDREAIRNVAKRLKWSNNGLARKYRFNLFVRDKDNGIVNLAGS
jgi:hypothetical protein